MTPLVGRASEQQMLRDVLASDEAELVCVYGRRRIGKTFLVREFFAPQLVFELTGTFGAPLREQLRNFTHAFADATPPSTCAR